MMISLRKGILRRGQGVLLVCCMLMASGVAYGQAAEAASSCVVVHQPADAEKKAASTCFENIALERTSFESGVCQWKSDGQIAENVQTTTHFVPQCPSTYRAYCDRLVLGPQMIVPVKIYIYDRSVEVLERAKKQCLSGGGTWNTNNESEVAPFSIEDGLVDQSTYMGWRIFHSTCHGCHGVDATGTSVAPDLVERVKRLSARQFSIKVLSRYRITMSAQSAAGDDQTEVREAFLEQVLRHERGELIMPAWQQDSNVKPHILDIYAYLRARADGALPPGRPRRQDESE